MNSEASSPSGGTPTEPGFLGCVENVLVALDGFVGHCECPEDNLCTRCAYANEVMDAWADRPEAQRQQVNRPADGETPVGGEAPVNTEQLVWFHGTTPENAALIEKDGFRADTWFARHMEDAVAFGGPCVFFVKVEFSDAPLDWQVHSSNAIPASAIQKRFNFMAGGTPTPAKCPRCESTNKKEFIWTYTSPEGFGCKSSHHHPWHDGGWSSEQDVCQCGHIRGVHKPIPRCGVALCACSYFSEIVAEGTPKGSPGEREEFEKWAKSQGDSCSRVECICREKVHAHARYDSAFTEWEWKAWQARASRSLPEDRKVWIDSINAELANLREWANREARRADVAEAKLAASEGEARSLPAPEFPNATPGPWSFAAQTTTGETVAIELHAPSGLAVELVRECDDDSDRAEHISNAALIVAAVNAYRGTKEK